MRLIRNFQEKSISNQPMIKSLKKRLIALWRQLKKKSTEITVSVLYLKPEFLCRLINCVDVTFLLSGWNVNKVFNVNEYIM